MRMWKGYDIYGNPIVRWVVMRNRTEFCFETYASALQYWKSHQVT